MRSAAQHSTAQHSAPEEVQLFRHHGEARGLRQVQPAAAHKVARVEQVLKLLALRTTSDGRASMVVDGRTLLQRGWRAVVRVLAAWRARAASLPCCRPHRQPRCRPCHQLTTSCMRSAVLRMYCSSCRLTTSGRVSRSRSTCNAASGRHVCQRDAGGVARCRRARGAWRQRSTVPRWSSTPSAAPLPHSPSSPHPPAAGRRPKPSPAAPAET